MSRTSTPKAQPDTLLIVDDVPANLAVATADLEDRGYQTAVAQSGEDALERAALLQPDLILLDVMMPEMDGFETCRRLKACERTREIPVIFMTALSETANKVAGFNAGGVDYVTKPFEIEEVVARINTHLTLHAMRKELEARNEQLRREIKKRERFEAALRDAHDELEERVAARTAELAEANAALKQEITERKRIEKEREALLASEQAARSKAEAADRLKDEFLATLSHELRTPLTAIIGWVQLLRAGKLSAAAVQRGCEVIERSSWAELRIVEDLLDISAIARGKMTLKAQPVCLAPAIQSAVDSLSLAAEAKCIDISLSLSPMSRAVWGDPSRLQQVVWNLLSNAIKFTPPGGRVAVLLEEVGATARIRVSDTGEGISADFLPHVFDQFRQADSSSQRSSSGIGLGLSIVRHLVEMHGGSVRGESGGREKGATFTVDLPLMPATDEAAVPPSASAGKAASDVSSALTRRRVLLIDDEPDLRELMARILADAGAEVRMATGVPEGLEMFERWRPDVIVSDIGLPGQDGYALIQTIRALPADRGGHTPAAALTAYADQKTREKALSSGYQVHLSKPIEPAAFLEAIASLVGAFACHGPRDL